jgi:hypothetical protein
MCILAKLECFNKKKLLDVLLYYFIVSFALIIDHLYSTLNMPHVEQELSILMDHMIPL